MVFFIDFEATPIGYFTTNFNMKKIAAVTIAICIAACIGVKAQGGANSLSTTGITSGSGMAYNLTNKEDTKGSRYLFDTWVKGNVTDDKGNPVNSDNYTFNYDKVGGSLLVSQDKQTAIAADKEHVKAFVVYDKNGSPMAFEYVPVIDATHYCQVLAAGSKFKVYKLIKTQFVKADFKNNGLSSSGNKYDEYVDEAVYYVTDIKTSAPQKISLKNKAIKQAFAADADKVATFYKDHKDDDTDETFLAKLGAYLNQ